MLFKEPFRHGAKYTTSHAWAAIAIFGSGIFPKPRQDGGRGVTALPKPPRWRLSIRPRQARPLPQMATHARPSLRPREGWWGQRVLRGGMKGRLLDAADGGGGWGRWGHWRRWGRSLVGSARWLGTSLGASLEDHIFPVRSSPASRRVTLLTGNSLYILCILGSPCETLHGLPVRPCIVSL